MGFFKNSFKFIKKAVQLLSSSNSKNCQKLNTYIKDANTDDYEHRNIAKNILNRNLYPNEIVHHINGRRFDNSISNLCVMDRQEHELFHAWIAWTYKKKRTYPSIKDQRTLLVGKYNGILLDSIDVPQMKFKSNSIPENRSVHYPRNLYFNLKRERNRLARERNIPPYLVFKNYTLVEMAQVRPQNLDAMRRITGVTEEKLRLYGNELLKVVSSHNDKGGLIGNRRSI